MAKPRPCECGCLPRSHAGPNHTGLCVNCSWRGRLPRCPTYRGAPRTEPLRASDLIELRADNGRMVYMYAAGPWWRARSVLPALRPGGVVPAPHFRPAASEAEAQLGDQWHDFVAPAATRRIARDLITQVPPESVPREAQTYHRAPRSDIDSDRVTRKQWVAEHGSARAREPELGWDWRWPQRRRRWWSPFRGLRS